ncbi:MAG: hypothetical protein ACYTEQ_05295 [Planctomycetota bacterium]|jgi:hypothetical protein
MTTKSDELRKWAARIAIAISALRGEFDGVVQIASDLKEERERSTRLKKAIASVSQQSHYWHKLWFRMGSDFARTQSLLTEEIDRLRKKCGEWDGKPYLDGKLQDSFEDRFVKPKIHPAVGIEVSPEIVIENPPARIDPESI